MNACNLELVKILRKTARDDELNLKVRVHCDIAADAIEQLEQENQRLKYEDERVRELEKELGIDEHHVTTTELIFRLHASEEETYKLREAYKLLQNEKEDAEKRMQSMEQDLTELMRAAVEGCEICEHKVNERRGCVAITRCGLTPGVGCKPEWRGNKND